MRLGRRDGEVLRLLTHHDRRRRDREDDAEHDGKRKPRPGFSLLGGDGRRLRTQSLRIGAYGARPVHLDRHFRRRCETRLVLAPARDNIWSAGALLARLGGGNNLGEIGRRGGNRTLNGDCRRGPPRDSGACGDLSARSGGAAVSVAFAVTTAGLPAAPGGRSGAPAGEGRVGAAVGFASRGTSLSAVGAQARAAKGGAPGAGAGAGEGGEVAEAAFRAPAGAPAARGTGAEACAAA